MHQVVDARVGSQILKVGILFHFCQVRLSSDVVSEAA